MPKRYDCIGVALDEAQGFYGGIVAFGAAAQQCSLAEVVKDLVPQRILFFLGGSDGSVEDRRSGESMKHFMRQSSDDILIGTI